MTSKYCETDKTICRDVVGKFELYICGHNEIFTIYPGEHYAVRNS